MICVKNSKCIWFYLLIGLWTKISRKQKENSEPTINGRVLFLNLTLRVMYWRRRFLKEVHAYRHFRTLSREHIFTVIRHKHNNYETVMHSEIFLLNITKKRKQETRLRLRSMWTKMSSAFHYTERVVLCDLIKRIYWQGLLIRHYIPHRGSRNLIIKIIRDERATSVTRRKWHRNSYYVLGEA